MLETDRLRRTHLPGPSSAVGAAKALGPPARPVLLAEVGRLCLIRLTVAPPIASLCIQIAIGISIAVIEPVAHRCAPRGDRYARSLDLREAHVVVSTCERLKASLGGGPACSRVERARVPAKPTIDLGIEVEDGVSRAARGGEARRPGEEEGVTPAQRIVRIARLGTTGRPKAPRHDCLCWPTGPLEELGSRRKVRERSPSRDAFGGLGHAGILAARDARTRHPSPARVVIARDPGRLGTRARDGVER